MAEISSLKLSVVDKKRKLRRVDLLAEKRRLEGLLYNYSPTSDDYIIKRMINNVNKELQILDECKKKIVQ